LARLFALAYQQLHREEGQGLTEYAFLLVGIVAVVGAIVALITTGLTTKIGSIF
jgi:Flp pilus assembly pilin Flp